MYDEDRPYEVIGLPADPANRAYAWSVGIGLQSVDGLTPSPRVYELAQGHIEGKYTYQQVEDELTAQHGEALTHDRIREADISATRIARLIQEPGFVCSPATLRVYHREIFAGLIEPTWVGVWRSEHIAKREFALGDETVAYAPPFSIADTLAYDFDREHDRTYTNLPAASVTEQAISFISGIWQIHPFREGNTRTCAAFAIKYLRHLGIEVDNKPFAENAVYFRDALVLANGPRGKQTQAPLKLFSEALLDPSVELSSLRPQSQTSGSSA
ncbi:MAG: Fic family protein [Promicromonosporaceae bacterium]|nr:Fic family protein [Promicromonosporaceae bacterium]